MFLKITKFLKCLPDLKLLCGFKYGGILHDYGWWKSYKKGLPIDKDGNPIPWITYPFIEFINGRLNKILEVFEWGSGNSTLWYASKVKALTSVEHDKKWFEKIKNSMPDNVKIFYQELAYGGKYSKYPNIIGKNFNIIIVDGRDRVNCLRNAIDAITKDGVIILDDSERKQYKKGIHFLVKNEFKRIDFWGFSPGLFYRKCTSIFYKSKNCLGI